MSIMTKVIFPLLYVLITIPFSYGSENDFTILGQGQKLKLAMVGFNENSAELIDLESIRIVNTNINLERHIRYFNKHTWATQASLSNETFNCENNTITSNLSTYLYPYSINGMDDLNPIPFPKKGTVKRGDNTLKVLCDFVWKMKEKDRTFIEDSIKQSLITINKNVVLIVPANAFALPELITPTFNNEGKVVSTKETDLLLYIKKNKS